MYYIVQPKDTLYGISLQYNTTVSQLMNLNPRIINPNLIFVGEKIQVVNQWGFNPWRGNEWLMGQQEYQRGVKKRQKGIKERQKGRAEYRKGREEYFRYHGR